MIKYIRVLILSVILLGCNSCVPILPLLKPSKVSPDMAAASAVYFAKEAVIDRNQPEAYDFLSEGMRRTLSFDQYIDMLSRMHPQGFPGELTATEYEPAPGREALFVWLSGKNKGEEFYYRLRMEGTTEKGYRVGEMLRVKRLPASQSREALPVRRSTTGLDLR